MPQNQRVFVPGRVLEWLEFPLRSRFPSCKPPLLEYGDLWNNGDGIIPTEILYFTSKALQNRSWSGDLLFLRRSWSIAWEVQHIAHIVRRHRE
jgi:hypothetical protein